MNDRELSLETATILGLYEALKDYKLKNQDLPYLDRLIEWVEHYTPQDLIGPISDIETIDFEGWSTEGNLPLNFTPVKFLKVHARSEGILDKKIYISYSEIKTPETLGEYKISTDGKLI